jgi:hypothetical protein
MRSKYKTTMKKAQAQWDNMVPEEDPEVPEECCWCQRRDSCDSAEDEETCELYKEDMEHYKESLEE